MTHSLYETTGILRIEEYPIPIIYRQNLKKVVNWDFLIRFYCTFNLLVLLCVIAFSFIYSQNNAPIHSDTNDFMPTCERFKSAKLEEGKRQLSYITERHPSEFSFILDSYKKNNNFSFLAIPTEGKVCIPFPNSGQEAEFLLLHYLKSSAYQNLLDELENSSSDFMCLSHFGINVCHCVMKQKDDDYLRTKNLFNLKITELAGNYSLTRESIPYYPNSLSKFNIRRNDVVKANYFDVIFNDDGCNCDYGIRSYTEIKFSAAQSKTIQAAVDVLTGRIEF